MKSRAVIVEEDGLYTIILPEEIKPQHDPVFFVEVEHDLKQGINEADLGFLALNTGNSVQFYLNVPVSFVGNPVWCKRHMI
ncbi:MAG: hypothetical protein HYV68_01690 [Candidatus Taylorbacteria bacterium]|nr:hypothetical protein [Candidatus Taylorbacteria bacterium]